MEIESILEKRKDKINGMAVAWIIVGIILLLIFAIRLVSAGWPLGKEATCIMLNASDIEDCDRIWCNVIDCNYNITLSACVCYSINNTIINNTIIINETINQSENFDQDLEDLKKYFDNNIYLVLDGDFRNLQAKLNILNIKD